MNYGAEPADQVVRYTLEGTEFALKISGTAAKNFAVFALAVLRDQKKTHGKTKLVRLLREGKPLKFFSVPTDQMRDFAKAAKSHGLLYVPIRDRSDPDNIEIAVWAEDAAKVNRVIDKLQLDVVDTGEAELVADVQKGQSQPVPEKETMVVMSIEQYTALIDGADAKLDEADAAAKSDPVRLSHEEVFGNVRAQFRGRK